MAQGGGACPDAALQALALAGMNLPAGRTPRSDLLLVTDSSAEGSRAQSLYITDRLLRRGVRVHTLLSGACAGSEAPPLPLQSLYTGGTVFSAIDAGGYLTDTLIALHWMDNPDTIVAQRGTVSPGNPVVIPFAVDGSLETMAVGTTLRWTGCLT